MTQINGKNLNLLDIAAGLADADIIKIAKNLAALTSVHGSNYPVDLRYFWEFNINASQPPSFSNATYTQNDGCFIGQGTPVNIPGYSVAPPLNLQFTSAWIHIWNVFASVYANMNPRPNVSFVWNPNVVGSTNVGKTYVDASTFYPNNAYVDWIAADGYNKLDITSHNPVGFDAVFSGFYAEYTNTTVYNAKPLMVGETGSCENLAPPYDQASYFATIASELPTVYPAIRAIDYFDEKASYDNGNPGCSWALDANGIAAFGTLAHMPYFVQSIPGTY